MTRFCSLVPSATTAEDRKIDLLDSSACTPVPAVRDQWGDPPPALVPAGLFPGALKLGCGHGHLRRQAQLRHRQCAHSSRCHHGCRRWRTSCSRCQPGCQLGWQWRDDAFQTPAPPAAPLERQLQAAAAGVPNTGHSCFPLQASYRLTQNAPGSGLMEGDFDQISFSTSNASMMSFWDAGTCDGGGASSR